MIAVVCLSCEPRPHPAKHFPITSGRPVDLPPRGASLRVIALEPEVQHTMVEGLQHHGYRIMSRAGAAAVILGEVVDQPAIGAGVTPEVMIRLQRPPGTASVLLGRAMMPIAISREDGVLHALTCQALATAWGYRPSGQLEILSEHMCAVGTAETW